MGYSIQNSETGEMDYIHCDDTENFQHIKIDEETGEPSNDKLKVRYVKHKSFQVPKKLLRGTACEEFDKEVSGVYEYGDVKPVGIQVTFKTESENEPKQKQRYDKDYFINMKDVKNEIILGYTKANYHMFLIPTLFCFNVYLAVILAILETFLHFWAHHKNAMNMNKDIYFRSPLHLLTSQFCATCRSEWKVEIKVLAKFKQQMRNARKSTTLKDVTKVIS